MALLESEYNQILKEYRYKNQMHIDRLENIKKTISEKSPRIKEIDDEIRNKSINFAKKLATDDKELNDYISQIEKLKNEKLDIIKKLGYKEEDLTPKYDCKECKDTGFIGGKRCKCFDKKIIEILYDNSHLGNILDKENFATFNIDYYGEDIIDKEFNATAKELAISARNKSIKFVRNFDLQYKNIIFNGNVGAGKTFLSHCIAKELLDNGKSVVYLTAFRFFDTLAKEKFSINNRFSGETENGDYSRNKMLNCDLLIIDDLGTELVNSFTNGELFAFINERMLNKKPIIISTNLDISELQDIYGERVCSRLLSFENIKLIGSDIRKKQKRL